MKKGLRDRLTYANVVATLALIVAVSGGSYAVAVSKIDGGDIKKRSLTGNLFKSNSVDGRVIKERTLSPVPRARNAARLGGQPGGGYLDRCPDGMVPVSDVCFETQPREPLPYGSATTSCRITDNRERPGRRLPTHNELSTAIGESGIELASGGELTAEVWPSPPPDETLMVLYITDDPADKDGVGLTPNTDAGKKSYRCVADPVN